MLQLFIFLLIAATSDVTFITSDTCPMTQLNRREATTCHAIGSPSSASTNHRAAMAPPATSLAWRIRRQEFRLCADDSGGAPMVTLRGRCRPVARRRAAVPRENWPSCEASCPQRILAQLVGTAASIRVWMRLLMFWTVHRGFRQFDSPHKRRGTMDVLELLHLDELSHGLANLPMFPYFDMAHYVVSVMSLREQPGKWRKVPTHAKFRFPLLSAQTSRRHNADPVTFLLLSPVRSNCFPFVFFAQKTTQEGGKDLEWLHEQTAQVLLQSCVT